MKTNYLSTLRILGVAVLSTGLAVASGAVSAADDAAPKAKSNSMGAAISDTALTTKVKAKLMGDKELSNSKVSVKTTNGVVTLTGTASSAEAKAYAGTTAEGVEGVKSVDNNLKVATNTTTTTGKVEGKMESAKDKTEEVTSDSWITTKVKSELLADTKTKGLKVHVKTKDKVVMLSGSLPTQDAVDQAKEIAGKVKGVKSVDTSELKVVAK